MSEEQTEHKVLYPNTGSNVFFQADYRVVLPFFRLNPGVMVMPWTAPLHALALVGMAYLCRRLFLWWIGNDGTGWLGVLLDPRQGFILVWPIFAFVLCWICIDPASENARREYEEEEVFSPQGNRNLYSTGWPRLLDPHEFYSLSPIEQRRRWRRATLIWEPAIGLLAASVMYFVLPAFGIWLGWCVLLLRGSSAGIVYRERQRRLNFEQSIYQVESQKQVLKETKNKTRRRRTKWTQNRSR